jgi:hypothetical protein
MNFLLSNLAEYALTEARLVCVTVFCFELFLSSELLIFLFSEEEIDYWKTVGIITEMNRKEIIEWKTIYPTSDLDKSEIVKIISLILETSLKPVLEISQMYTAVRQKLSSKNVSLHQNPFDLLTDSTILEARNEFITSNHSKESNSPNLNNHPGLLARIVQDCISYKSQKNNLFAASPLSPSTTHGNLMKLLEHIENPFQQLAKKGFGLLSRGLGRLGFGTENEDSRMVEHPGNNDTLVVFIVGGISFKEVGQVQSLLQEYQNITGTKVILMSNNVVSSEELLQLVFNPF